MISSPTSASSASTASTTTGSKAHQITRQKNIDLASSVSRSRRSRREHFNARIDEPYCDDDDYDLDEDIAEDYLATVAAAAAAAAAANAAIIGDEAFESVGANGEKNEIELINESLSKLTTRLINEDDLSFRFQQFDFNSSTIAAAMRDNTNEAQNTTSTNTPSTSSSSSSPSNLLSGGVNLNNSPAYLLSTPDHNMKSTSNKSLNSTSMSSDSSSSASVSPAPFSMMTYTPTSASSLYQSPTPSTTSSPTTKSSSTTTTTTTPIYPSYLDSKNTTTTTTTTTTTSTITAVRRLSKSPGKQLVATNSVPIVQPKPKRLTSLMRLSSNGPSFFSRSCPGEDIDEQQQQQTDDSKSNTTTTTTTKPKSPDTSSQHGRHLGKSLFAFAARASRAVKKSSVESNSSSSNTSSIANLSEDREYSSKINGFEVDMEKLARELILPSLNTPLTSFKTSNNNSETMLASSSSTSTTKPPLQSSKTIDSNPSLVLQQTNKKKLFVRSMTAQNK